MKYFKLFFPLIIMLCAGISMGLSLSIVLSLDIIMELSVILGSCTCALATLNLLILKGD